MAWGLITTYSRLRVGEEGEVLKSEQGINSEYFSLAQIERNTPLASRFGMRAAGEEQWATGGQREHASIVKRRHKQ